VSHQAQARGIRIATVDARHQRLTLRGRARLEGVQAGSAEELAQYIGVARLVTGGRTAVVDALVTDERLQ